MIIAILKTPNKKEEHFWQAQNNPETSGSTLRNIGFFAVSVPGDSVRPQKPKPESSAKRIPSRELTYPPKWDFEDDFPFPKVAQSLHIGL